MSQNRKFKLDSPRIGYVLQVLGTLILIVSIACVPLLTKLTFVNLKGLSDSYFAGWQATLDVFCWLKAEIAVYLGASVAVLLPLYLVISKQSFVSQNRTRLVLLTIFSTFLIYSCLTSKHPELSWSGFPEQLEGMKVWLSYFAVFLGALAWGHSDRSMKVLLFAFSVSSSLIAIIGMIQFFGYDPLLHEPLKSFVFTKELMGSSVEMHSAFGRGTLASTLFNPNYAGNYASIAFIFGLGFFLISNRRSYQNLSLIYCCIMFAMAVGSQTRAAVISAVVMGLLLGLIFRSDLRNKIFKSSILLVFLILIYLGFSQAINGKFLASLFELSDLSPKSQQSELASSLVKEFKVKSTEVRIEGKTNKGLVLTLSYPEIKVTSLDGDNLGIMKLGDPEFNVKGPFYLPTVIDAIPNNNFYKLNLKIQDIRPIQITVTPLGFRIEAWGSYHTSESYQRWPSFLPDGFFSHRGYIWSRTIPLLQHKVFKGAGIGHFPLEFPQKDFGGKLKSYENHIVLVDKPHSFYLQLAHASGLLGLMFFLIFILEIGCHCLGALKRKTKLTLNEKLSIIFFVSSASFLIAGLAMDSFIGVTVVFWVFLGLSVARSNMPWRSLKKGI